ncbi:MAG: S8 family serine peptidase, partial [Prevotellaceae bacterium]|nr:S8 family serine peptidase [Prevotellaceae bacterium]
MLLKPSIVATVATLLTIGTSLFIAGCSNEMDEIFANETPVVAEPTANQTLHSNYYWYKGKQIPLHVVDDKIFVLYDTANDLSDVPDIRRDQITNPIETRADGSYVTSGIAWGIVAIDPSTRGLGNTWTDHTPLPRKGKLTSKVVETDDGTELAVSQIFYVKLKTQGSISKLNALCRAYNVNNLGQNKAMPLWYMLECTAESYGNALEMANLFYESGYFEAAEADLIDLEEEQTYLSAETNAEASPSNAASYNDTYVSKQWNLNSIHALEAASITKGSSDVIVAIVDQGIELNHADLNVYGKSYNSETGRAGSVVYGNHATAVAGIISGVANNGIGIAGIAPESPVMSISNTLASTADSRQKRANAIIYAIDNGASIINNSWSSSTQSALIDDAITAALTQGRNGKGCIVIFSVGNDNSGTVNYPANSNPDILAVGAMSTTPVRKTPSSPDGETNWGSNYGASLDIMAPGLQIYTTDLSGRNGYSTTDYYARF